MKKRFLSLLTALCLLVAMAPSALAAEGVVCKEENCAHAAAIGDTHYDSLTDAVTAAVSGDTVTLRKDLSDAGVISLPAGVTLDGGNHTISGNSSVYVSAAGGTVQNTTFQNIHNDISQCSALYAEGLTGALTVTGCTFDTCDWDAMQITPKAGSQISITNNIFRTTGEITPNRYIHVETVKDGQPAYGVDLSITVEKNQFYDGDKLKGANMEVYYPKEDSGKVKLSGNYMDQVASVCIMVDRNTYAPELALPLADVNFQNEVYPAVTYLDVNLHLFYETVQQAIDAGVASIAFSKDISEDITIPVGKTVTLNDNGKTFTGTITNNGTLKIAEGGPYDLAKITNQGTVVISGGTFTTEPDADWIASGCVAAAAADSAYYTVSPVTDEAAMAAGCVVRYGKADAADRAYYKSLKDAFKEHPGKKMYLLADVTEDVSTTGKIELSGEGHQFIGSLETGGVMYLYEGRFEINSLACTKFTVNSVYSKLPANIIIKDANISDTMTIQSNATVSIEGGTYPKNITIYNTGALTVNGGTFGKNIANNGTNSSLTIHDGAFNTLSTSSTSSTVIKGGSFTGAVTISKNAAAVIEGGSFGGAVSLTEGGTGSLTISGGYFTNDVTEYCVEGKMAVRNKDANRDAYPFKVDDIPDYSVEVRTAATAGVTTASVDSSITDKDAALSVANGVVPSENGNTLGKAETVADSVLDSEKAAAIAKLEANGIITVDESNGNTTVKDQQDHDATVTIVHETYLDVEVTALSNMGDNKSITLDIQPKYNLKATIDAPDSMTPAHTVTLATGKPLTVAEGRPVDITIQLPTGFANVGDTVFVTHNKSDERVYKHECTVQQTDGKLMIAFTNDKGFSEFVVTLPAAKIDERSYATLQDAVNAVKDGQTIKVLKDGAEADVSRKVKFTAEKGDGVTSYTISVKGSYKNQSTAEGEYDIISTVSSSSGGGSGSGVPSYAVSTPSKVENGTVKVSPKSSGQGDTVTISAVPDEGYQVDKVVVTDKDGREIPVKDSGGGKYTFTMPASKVDVRVTFAEIGISCDGGKDCPVYHLADVNAGDWYHEAVDYAVTHKLMKGMSDTTFEPMTTTSRGMIVTILYRLEGEPEAAAAAFDDVAEGRYYTNAVSWAAANDIVNGYGNGSFGPDDTITREQMAAILYRYAAYKGYGVTEHADLSDYTDDDQISSYALDAMSWANAEGLINGMTTTTLEPAGGATRAQVAAILMRFCENVVK